jgi:hypothetical protein
VAVVVHALLCLLPAVVLAVPLLARRFPGERVLVTLRRGRRTRLARPRSCGRVRGRVLVVAVRGGRLIGCSLAVRPPPALLSPS